jgi:hypothetical protein
VSWLAVATTGRGEAGLRGHISVKAEGVLGSTRSCRIFFDRPIAWKSPDPGVSSGVEELGGRGDGELGRLPAGEEES